MIRLPDLGPSGPEVAKRLFVEFEIFVKHCAGKHMPEAERYLRIASRTEPDNKALVDALNRCLVVD